MEERGQPAPRVGELLLALWRLARPEIWLVTLVPVYVGYVLASREIAPGFEIWVDFWAGAAETGATTGEFRATLAAWWTGARGFALACVAMGPLVWAATLLLNDVHDLPSDRLNPRKAASPLVRGRVPVKLAQAAAYAFAAATLAVAALVGLTFALLVAAALVLAWLYSAPPARLKTRPGADVLVNAIGVGGLAGLAGWSLARPLSELPWVFVPQALLLAAAVYVPTTLVDLEPDRAAGYRTFATALGRRRAYLVGFGCWVAANAGAVAMASQSLLIPRSMLPVMAIFCPLMVYEYHAFIGRARDAAAVVQGIVLCSLTFLCVNLVFVLRYTGLWVA